jgi:tripartite-type tricarboxylate transporter receptor subunit TctC
MVIGSKEERMSFVRSVCVALAFVIAASHAAETPYPGRPVRVVVSNATGSTPDSSAGIRID